MDVPSEQSLPAHIRVTGSKTNKKQVFPSFQGVPNGTARLKENLDWFQMYPESALMTIGTPPLSPQGYVQRFFRHMRRSLGLGGGQRSFTVTSKHPSPSLELLESHQYAVHHVDDQHLWVTNPWDTNTIYRISRDDAPYLFSDSILVSTADLEPEALELI